MGDVREGRGDVKEGRRIPSQFILIPAVSFLRARWSGTTGRDGGPQQWEGRRAITVRRREGRRVEKVWRENEQTLILFPGDMWS